MKRSTLNAHLLRLGACSEAMRWRERYPRLTPAQLWAKCPDARWMFWLAGRVDADRKAIVLAACACARLALVHVPAGETRPLQCIETTEAWARGEATIEQVNKARRLAWQAFHAAADAAADAANAAAAAAAHAAAAAYDAYAAADAAAYSAYDAADAAAYAADAAAADARTKTLRKCAVAVRRHLPWSVVCKALEEQARKVGA